MERNCKITVYDGQNNPHTIHCDRSRLKYSVRSHGVLEIDTGTKLIFVKDYTHIVIEDEK